MVEVKIENIFVGFHAFRTFALFRLPNEIGWESDGN